ncbi:MAG: Xaa-Pro peptidase family protein [Candidatus Nanopelagicales bacterium]
MNPDRLARAQSATKAAGLDALLITPGASLRYLTGYDAIPLERLTCLIVPAEGAVSLVAPALEVAAAEASPLGAWNVPIAGWAETDDPFALVARMLPQRERLGLDDQMPAAKVLHLRAAMPDAEQRLASEVLRGLRMVKSSDEIKALRQAAEAIDRVHEQIADWLQVGRTEREVGEDISEAILAEGHVRVDFVIVGSGPNGASPHHELSDRRIERSEPVVVDIGGTMPSGYCSDSTRNYCVGAPPDDYLAYYAPLVEAHAAAVAQVRPGVTAESVDAAARDELERAGFGKQFIHRTGHDIGLETHEDPYIVTGNNELLQPGMAFSVEPGVYLPGRHGARIEDIVVVTETGADSLNKRPRELEILDPSFSS